MCACKEQKNLIRKNPLALNFRFDSWGFFVLMVVFCKNRTLSARSIADKISISLWNTMSLRFHVY